MDNYLDHYCERIAPGLWGEPFNLFSNLTFLLSAFFIYRKYHVSKFQPSSMAWDHWLLLILLLAIGIGSTLWHLLANYWSLWLDRIPILLFINIYLLSALLRILGLSVFATLAIFVLYHLINTTVQFAYPPETLNGSLFYVPTFVFLIAITIVVWSRHLPTKQYFLFASVIFAVSLLFRTIDQWACNSFSTGTHFIWHLLNAVTLYLLMSGLIMTKQLMVKHVAERYQ